MKTIFLLLVGTILQTVICFSAEERSADARGETQRVAFSQSCFWTGEMKLGQIDGVIRTEAGFLEGHEVTVVDFLPARLSLTDLVRQAKDSGVADSIHFSSKAPRPAVAVLGIREGAPLDQSYRVAPASDQKKQIEGTPLGRLRLTPEQATKVNAFARTNPGKALEYLTPAQREQLQAGK